ncbi:Membrane-bound hydrophilic protein OS=Streptomyces tendae OX=1932 GN=GUR47_13790 PE=4 SV=1 [Streptomyces tendae]
MPADEVTRGTDVESSRVRTGPRHAAPKKPLFTRFHMPAGKAIAIAAMPTAVLMGMGFTPTLALADGNDAAPPSNSLTADEYKDCVAALEDAEKDPSASPTPSPSATDGADDGKDDAKEPDPSASTGDTGEDAGTDAGSDQGDSSSSDSGSDDKGAKDEQDAPAPSPSASQSQEASGAGAAEPSPSESEGKGGLLDGLGDAIEGIFTGGKKAEESPSPTPTPSASEGAGDASDALKDTTGTVTDTAKDTVEGATDTASKAAEDAEDTVDKAAEAAKEAAQKAKEDAEKAKEDATATPSPSASESADEAAKDAEDCPAATDAEGGVDNKLPLPDDPWYLNASSLLLKGASYKGVVEVRTANGTTKKVLKYVISNGTDIGDLHQTVNDKQAGKTYHVQAAKGSTSTIRDGETVMYTESISGNLLGLIPITFDPENPPPLDIPLIYFTKVTVVQAGQFGGTLHVPGLHQYTTD